MNRIITRTPLICAALAVAVLCVALIGLPGGVDSSVGQAAPTRSPRPGIRFRTYRFRRGSICCIRGRIRYRISVISRNQHALEWGDTMKFPTMALTVGLSVAAAVILGVGLALKPGQIAHAATITVNTTTDENNTDGDCSLREAIIAANTDTAVDACPAGSGADTIVLAAGTYDFTLAGTSENNAATGDLVLADLTLTGVNANTTIIDGNGLATGSSRLSMAATCRSRG